MSFNHRLAEVKSYFDNGDTHIGYRRLLDAAIDTREMNIYADTLEFCDWYDTQTQQAANNSGLLSEKVSGLLEKIEKESPVKNETPATAKLTARQVKKAYQRGSFTLGAVDMELYPAQIIGLVGENGNGKTTLLRLLYGELAPDSGSLSYHLNDVPANHDFYDIKTRLAFIPQRPSRWYGSLMDNLRFTSTHYGFKGRENMLWTEMICARMGLRPYRDYTWGRISSGYKMRFELAKTLLKKPEILLLDEPLANLDILAQQVILEDLRFLAHSNNMPLGIILSSQQLYEVEKVSEHVIFLKQGQPRYQYTNTKTANQPPTQLIIEIETTADRETIQQIFSSLGISHLTFNGGVYILYFPEETVISEVIRVLGEAKLPVKYFRDISSSSRRFFEA